MNTTDEQIKTVEALRDRYATIEGSQNHTALTAILADWRESRELLEAFQMGTFVVDGSVLVIVPAAGGFKIGDGSNGDERRFNSALDAFAEVKKQETGNEI